MNNVHFEAARTAASEEENINESKTLQAELPVGVKNPAPH